LRTLKDVERFITNQDLGDPFSNDYRCKWLVVEDDLRSCAREWIKAIDNHRWGNSDKYLEEHPKLKEAIEPDYYHCQVIEEWIKYFFNLEEK